MVLEALLDAEHARRHPWEIVALSIIFVSAAILATQYLKTDSPSMLLMLFTCIPSIPFLLNLCNYDEQKEEEELRQERYLGSRTLARHSGTILVLLSFFLGLVIAFTFWFLYLPPSESSSLFSLQQNELKSISSLSSGYATSLSAGFEYLFVHNFGVLVLALVFSVIYGAGAVFILTWNASIIGVFIGTFALRLAQGGNHGLFESLGIGAAGILPHGIFELLAYLTIALAGGILSSAIIRRQYLKGSFLQIAYDVVKLSAWAIIFLAIGAFIESLSL